MLVDESAVNNLVSIPKLQDIAESPALASGLPPDVVDALLGECSVFRGTLVNRILALRVNGSSQTDRPTEGARLLNVREAAAKPGTTEDWLYRHAADLPFTARVGKKRVRFSDAGMDRCNIVSDEDLRQAV